MFQSSTRGIVKAMSITDVHAHRQGSTDVSAAGSLHLTVLYTQIYISSVKNPGRCGVSRAKRGKSTTGDTEGGVLTTQSPSR